MQTADSGAVPVLEPASPGIWENGIGNGFTSGAQSLSFDAGAGYGVKIFGGSESHDLALTSLTYGYMLGGMGRNSWYNGDWELRGQLFGGEQFKPRGAEFVGVTPHLRYNFMTGTRWVPFLDVGFGATATTIGPPDLSRTFEFNFGGGPGVRWFIRDNLALGVEAAYLHMSSDGLHKPNLGVNNVNLTFGVSWFF